MKWINWTDKIPDKQEVTWRRIEDKNPLDINLLYDFMPTGIMYVDKIIPYNTLEWLDETASTPTHGRTAEEIDISNLTDEFKADYIDACSDNRKLRKMLAEVTGLSRIATVEEYSSQFKAMEEHRTQPQEGKEEVECTHPYKECVMSDRVNKYGTPLTKCSVCGNDNICDEELMDESVNTF